MTLFLHLSGSRDYYTAGLLYCKYQMLHVQINRCQDLSPNSVYQPVGPVQTCMINPIQCYNSEGEESVISEIQYTRIFLLYIICKTGLVLGWMLPCVVRSIEPALMAYHTVLKLYSHTVYKYIENIVPKYQSHSVQINIPYSARWPSLYSAQISQSHSAQINITYSAHITVPN